MKFCAHCKAIVISFRPWLYVTGQLNGKEFYLHRVCMNQFLGVKP